MARYWENNGEPLADGRYCLVIDPEDGTHPIRTYGITKEAVTDKLAKSLEHGQRTIARLREPAASPARASRPAAPAADPAIMTPEEVMTETANLSNPSRAPQAIARLAAHNSASETHRATQAEYQLATVAEQWDNTHSHEEFYRSLTNQKLLLNTAVLQAGGAEKVTVSSMERTYQALLAQNAFAAESTSQRQPETPQVPPEGTPALRTVVRPRGATSYISSSLRATAPASSTPKPKYTRAQVDAMDGDELAYKMRTEPGFSELLANYAANRNRASA